MPHGAKRVRQPARTEWYVRAGRGVSRDTYNVIVIEDTIRSKEYRKFVGELKKARLVARLRHIDIFKNSNGSSCVYLGLKLVNSV